MASATVALISNISAVQAQETPAPTTVTTTTSATVTKHDDVDAIENEQAVSQVVDRLKSSTDQSVNLSDVAAAQDLMARLDLLYEIEGRINKLEALKEEKRKKTGQMAALDGLPMSQGAGSISALPMPAGAAGGMEEEDLQLVSVQGSGGNLTALVQSGNSTIRVGPNNRKIKDYDVLDIKPGYIKVKRKADKETKLIYLTADK